MSANPDCIYCGHTMHDHATTFAWDEYIAACRRCAFALGTSQVICFATPKGAWERMQERTKKAAMASHHHQHAI